MAVDQFGAEQVNRMCSLSQTSMAFATCHSAPGAETTVTYPESCSAAQLSIAKLGHQATKPERD